MWCMTIQKNFFYLPNAELLYLHHKDIFKSETSTPRAKAFKQLDISKSDFISACENPVAYARMNLSSIILGMIYPFRYKLYLPIFIGLLCFYLFNIVVFPPIFGDPLTTKYVMTFTSLITLFFIFALYSRAMWIRQVYHYLDKCYKNNQPVQANYISLKFKPHNLFFAVILGFPYAFCIMYSMLWIGAHIYLTFQRVFT